MGDPLIKNERPDLDNQAISEVKEVLNGGKVNNSQLDTQAIVLKYDGPIDIATGRSRKETHWRNKKVLLSALYSKVSVTQRTHESQAEYNSEKKTRQDEIKDVGGFVGGYVNNGRRKSENITHRQLITLDIDFAKGDVWGDLIMLYENAAAIYSTHKHSPDNQRLRLIIPLDRVVRTDEYVAIARRIADMLGINNFDDTTYEPERLMYWPSSSRDAEYVFQYQDGPWLSADDVLATYTNWRDASEWPVSDRVREVIRHEIKKQGDPMEKPGVVGAFCRTYTIHEVIEKFLDDEYETTNDENRYTYRRGSTAAGLVVYDDKYSFSHHGTDPTSGKLCNAFDLVRLHLFGLQDEDAKEGTPGNRLPSYTAMVDFAAKDGPTKKRIGVERLQDAKGDFAESLEDLEGEPVNTDWLEDLDVDGKGRYRNTYQNIRTILDNDPSLKGKYALNEFEHRELTIGTLPWNKTDRSNQWLIDADDSGLRGYLEETYGITGIQKINDALAVHIRDNAFHPIRDYLKSVSWDKEPRIETLLLDYMGSEDNEYVRAVTRKSFVAPVARILRPGCKFDYVLTLVGKEGQGKSTIIKKLGRQWYSDSFSTVQGKEALESIQGVWLVEMAELAGLKKAEIETIKHFISKQEDRYRVAYGKRVENFPRQCTFFATTNNKDFLQTETGNRRFWPVDIGVNTPTKDVFTDLDDYEIDQIWAEAVTLYNAGEPLYLSRALEEQAFIHQRDHSEKDERAGLIQRFLDTLLPEDWDEKELYERRVFLSEDPLAVLGTVQRQRVCVAEIWCELFGQKPVDMNRFNTKELHNIMRNMEGWEESRCPVKVNDFYKAQRVYRRIKSNIHEGKTNIHGRKGINIPSIQQAYTKN